MILKNMPRKYKIYINSLAEEDILNVFDFIAKDNFAIAIIFKSKIYTQIESLKNFPEKHPIISGLKKNFFKHRHLIFENYRIIYRISENTIIIVRFLHQKQLLSFD